MEYNFKIEGLAELKEAIKRNPAVIKSEVAKFLTRAIAKYKSTIMNNPWRVGMGGGGVPVKTGNLRDTHITKISPWEAYIQSTAPYGGYVHKRRPWLDYAYDQKEKEVEQLEKEMMDNILIDLAK